VCAITAKLLWFRVGKNFRGRDALVLTRGDHARFHCCVDRRNDHRLFDGGLQRPHAGPFLAGFIENYIDQRLAGLGIDLPEDLRGDFDQVAV
jgi:hypothetical protein